MGGRILLTDGDYSKPSVMAIFGGLGAGANLKRFSVGFIFLAAHGISNSSAGIWHDKNLHYVSASLGYTIFKNQPN